MLKVNTLSKEFVKSLKTEGAEEIVDIYLYRPLGFVLAKILTKTRITPNIITIAGIFWGILAGFLLSRGTVNFFIYGALIYQVANIFDCADGQLARLTSNYSDFGRILDGFVDYVNVSAVYVGSFIGLLRSRDTFFETRHTVFVMVFAVLSTAFAAALYDKLKSKYMNFVLDSEIVKEDTSALIEKRDHETVAVKRFLYTLYIFYLHVQCFFAKNISLKGKEVDRLIGNNRKLYRELYLSRNTKLLKAWSIVGPSTHALYFLLFALMRNLSWYFLFLVGPLNVVLLLLLYAQYHTEKSILSAMRETS